MGPATPTIRLRPPEADSWQAISTNPDIIVAHSKMYLLAWTAMAFSVYILELEDGSYYVGHTSYLQRRIKEHENRIACFHTKKIPMQRLVWHEEQPDRIAAAKREREIKGWRREKKIALWKSGSSLP